MRFCSFLVFLSACAGSTTFIDSGEYEVSSMSGIADESPLAEASLTMDVENGEATLHVGEAGPITLDLLQRKKADWVTGCPGNYSSQTMEVIDIDLSILEIEEVSFEDPIFVADCGTATADVPEVVLRADGDVGGGGGACLGADACVTFALVF